MELFGDGITVQKTDFPSERVSFEDFLKTPHAETPFGKRFIALMCEGADWPDIKITAHFREGRVNLQFHGRYFQDNNGTRSFNISSKSTMPSVAEVAILISEAYQHHKNTLRSVIATLQDEVRRIDESGEAIFIELAKQELKTLVVNSTRWWTKAHYEYYFFIGNSRREKYCVLMHNKRSPAKAEIYLLHSGVDQMEIVRVIHQRGIDGWLKGNAEKVR